ncbi:MAG: squalene/phytoene synthase family protein [Asticcacaulis sp.]|nr:squalene/phytoene synthase family protein [Asticcacaulis sp.]
MTSSELVPKSEDVRLACAFISDADRRAGVLALFALLETLRDIPERVTEPLMGEIRLRWWYEAFEAIGAGRTPHYHPLTELFQRLIPQYGLPVEAFLDLVEGQMPLLDKGPLNIKAALPVVERGEGQVLRLAARILGHDAQLTAVARLTGLARLKARGRLSEAGETEFVHLLRDARVEAKGLPVELTPLALPVALVHNLWHGREINPLALRLRLFWSFVAGRV